MKYQFLTTIFLGIMMQVCANNKPDSGVSPEMKKESLETIRKVLASESEWVKVHAAEFLLWSGNPEGVQEVFLAEEKLYDTKPQYRVGIWRVLAQTAASDVEKKVWTDKIMQAFLDTNGTDRIHAVETLAKLNISPLSVNDKITRQALESATKSLAFYTQWSVAYTSPAWQARTQKEFLDMLVAGIADGGAERQASYILRQFGKLSEQDWKKFVQILLNKPIDTNPNVNLYSAAFTTAPESLSASDAFKKIHKRLLHFGQSASKGDRYELAMALSINGSGQDIPTLMALLHRENPLAAAVDNADVAAAAGYALLKLAQK